MYNSDIAAGFVLIFFKRYRDQAQKSTPQKNTVLNAVIHALARNVFLQPASFLKLLPSQLK
jgi:hypothetical protein